MPRTELAGKVKFAADRGTLLAEQEVLPEAEGTLVRLRQEHFLCAQRHTRRAAGAGQPARALRDERVCAEAVARALIQPASAASVNGAKLDGTADAAHVAGEGAGLGVALACRAPGACSGASGAILCYT